MKPCTATLAALAMGVAQWATAAPPPRAAAEIERLLSFVDGSRCEFFRNGSAYDAHAAQAHLRDKYDYLAARNMVDTAEQFIDRAATQSSFSRRPYEVQCGSGPKIASRQWLLDELAHLRNPPAGAPASSASR